MAIKKFSHVIKCPFEACNLGYDKIVFDDGFVVTCGKKQSGIKRYFTVKTSVSNLYYMELTDGDWALEREKWILGRTDNGDYRIRLVVHTNIDANYQYYTTEKVLAIPEQTFEAVWKKVSTDKQNDNEI